MQALPPDPVARRDQLLAIPEVKTWHEGRALSSRLSADNDLRKLGLMLYRMELDPTTLVETAKKDPEKLQAVLIEYASKLKRNGRGDAHITKTFVALRNFLRFRKVEFDSFPKLKAPGATTTLARERVPTPEELGSVLEKLPLRSRVAALFMAHAGVRPAVLGGYQGRSGLTLGDLTDLDLKELRFKEIPFVITVSSDNSKTGTSYTTFGTAQLAQSCVAYLTQRRDGGERLTVKSPVIARALSDDLRGAAAASAETTKTRFMVTHAITDGIAKVLHASQPEGVTWRPYVLRSYCSTRLLLAEGQGRIYRDLREAILGHDTGVAGRYHVGKRWGEELLAEARREYANAAEFLETNAQSRVNVATEFRRTLLAVAGLSEEEAAAHVNDSNEELLAILRERLTGRGAGAPPQTTGNGNGHGIQKPVTLEEAEKLLAQGWTYVANFGPNRVILQAP